MLLLFLNCSRIILICQPDFKRINQLLEVVENKDKTALGTLSSIMIIAEVDSFSVASDNVLDFIWGNYISYDYSESGQT